MYQRTFNARSAEGRTTGIVHQPVRHPSDIVWRRVSNEYDDLRSALSPFRFQSLIKDSCLSLRSITTAGSFDASQIGSHLAHVGRKVIWLCDKVIVLRCMISERDEPKAKVTCSVFVASHKLIDDVLYPFVSSIDI